MEELITAAGPLALVLLALVDGTSVGTLVIPLMLLVTAEGGARRVAGRTVLYLLVIAAFYWVLGVALLAGLLPLLSAAGGWLTSAPAMVGLAAIGVLLIVWSFHADPKAVRKRGGDPEASGRRWADRARRAAGSPRVLMGLAVFAGVVEAASMIPYLAAMGIIAEMGIGLRPGAAVLLGYCALMIGPALVFTGGRLLAGAHLDRVLERVHTWAVRSAAGAFSWGIGIIGALIVLRTAGPALEALGLG